MHLPILPTMPVEGAVAPSQSVERDAILPSKNVPVIFGEIYGGLQKPNAQPSSRSPEAEENGDAADAEGEELANLEKDSEKLNLTKEVPGTSRDTKANKLPAVHTGDQKLSTDADLRPKNGVLEAVDRLPADIEPVVSKTISVLNNSTEEPSSKLVDSSGQPARVPAETPMRDPRTHSDSVVVARASETRPSQEVTEQKAVSFAQASDVETFKVTPVRDEVARLAQPAVGTDARIPVRAGFEGDVAENLLRKSVGSGDVRVPVEAHQQTILPRGAPNAAGQVAVPKHGNNFARTDPEIGSNVQVKGHPESAPAALATPSGREMIPADRVPGARQQEVKVGASPKTAATERTASKWPPTPAGVRDATPEARIEKDVFVRSGMEPPERQLSRIAPASRVRVGVAGSNSIAAPPGKTPTPQNLADEPVAKTMASDRMVGFNPVEAKAKTTPESNLAKTGPANPLPQTNRVDSVSPGETTPVMRQQIGHKPLTADPTDARIAPNKTNRLVAERTIQLEKAPGPLVKTEGQSEAKQIVAVPEQLSSSEKPAPIERRSPVTQAVGPRQIGNTSSAKQGQTTVAKVSPDRDISANATASRNVAPTTEGTFAGQVTREPTHIPPAAIFVPPTTIAGGRRRLEPSSAVATERTPQTPKTQRPMTAISPAMFPQPTQGRAEILQGDQLAPMMETSPFRSEQAPLSPLVGSPDAAQIRAESARIPIPQLVDIITRQPDRPVEIRLSPEELGRVRMTLSTTETGVTVVIVTERVETMDLMRRHIDQLAQEFRRMGYEDVGFDFKNSGSGAQSGGQNPSDHNEFGTIPLADTGESKQSAPPQPPTRLASTGLDLRV